MTITLADGGIETALIDRLEQELPEFAAFVLLDTAEGRAALRSYYAPFVELSRSRGLPLVLDTPTWRANPDWVRAVGLSDDDLSRVNADAVALVRELDDNDAPGAGTGDDVGIVVSGSVGPRFDEYVASERMIAEVAERYHAPQVRALAEAGADRVTAVTMLDAAEAIGVVRAAAACRIPVVVSFALGSDGLVGDGTTLAAAIAAVDAATDGAAEGFLVNCAHPSEVATGLELCAGEAALERVIGFRLNAARADDSGPGDEPAAFARAELALQRLAPRATVFGGCCGTDVPHIAALAAGTESATP